MLASRAKERAGYRMRALSPGVVQEFLGSPPPLPSGWTPSPYRRPEQASQGQSMGLIINDPGCGGPGYPCDHRNFLLHSDATVWPYATNVQFSPTGIGLSGSGTLIGRHTIMSCAHIFHQAGGGGTWYSTQTWRAGQVHSTVFGTDSYTTAYPPANPYGYTGCYAVTIPTSFIMGLSEGDVAVVDVQCGLTPGSSVGWLPPGYGVASDYLGASIQMQAYDGNSPYPPQPPFSLATYSYPTLIDRGLAGPWVAWLDATYSFQLNHLLDHTGGASGGGLVQDIFQSVGDPTMYWVADQHSGDFSQSRGRVLTASLWGFIQDNSSEY